MRALWLCLWLGTVSAPAVARHHGYANDSISGQFDYYLLSLSWSPAYCLVHPEDQPQCGTVGLGFVLHGLWPQYDFGGYPEYCPTDVQLTAAAAAVGASLYPSPRLLQHEWQSHGVCSGLEAVDYFRLADRALNAVRVPAVFDAPSHSLTMSRDSIATAFYSANPAMPVSAIKLGCSRDRLSEVRICLTRTLGVRSCGRGVRSSCPDGLIQIPSSR